MRPQDAATLIIIDRSGPPRILMGRRRPQQIFLPNKFVFPGGRADKVDRGIPAADELEETEQKKLLIDMKGSANIARARGLALAAVRETYEEAGLLIGQKAGQPVPSAPGGNSGDIGGWAGYFSEEVVPRLSPLTFLARAITPPGRPRRYDTRFFLVDASHIAKEVTPPDDELRELGWFTIDELRQLDVPNITRAVVEDLSEYLTAETKGADEWAVPYYFFKSGAFERVLVG